MRNKARSIIMVLGIAVFLAVGAFLLSALWEKSKIPAEKILENSEKPKKESVAKKLFSENDLIRIGFPSSNEKIGGSITVTGIAKGGWYFEGEFPIELVDASGKKLVSGSALAQGEWMKDEFTPFSGTLRYPVIKTTQAKLIIHKNNPSDLEENNASLEIPVILEPEMTTTQLFFGSRYLDQNVSVCDKVFSSARPAGENMALSRQTLEKLLEGPNEREKELGYFSSIPSGVKIQEFDATSKMARVDLSQELLNLDTDVACRRILMEKQISETVKKSSGAEKVVITVNGQVFPGKFGSEGPTYKK